MRTKETRQYEMFVRVRDFREAHRDLFPKKREGGQAFATVAAAVTQLTAYDDSKSKTSEEGKEAKAIARQALFDEIKSISRTAHVIARKSPGFGDLFKMPKSSRPTDQAVLGAGRVFADNAKSVRDRFLAHGMPETFVADLKRLVETFGEAIRERQTGKERQAVAHRSRDGARVGSRRRPRARHHRRQCGARRCRCAGRVGARSEGRDPPSVERQDGRAGFHVSGSGDVDCGVHTVGTGRDARGQPGSDSVGPWLPRLTSTPVSRHDPVSPAVGCHEGWATRKPKGGQRTLTARNAGGQAAGLAPSNRGSRTSAIS